MSALRGVHGPCFSAIARSVFAVVVVVVIDVVVVVIIVVGMVVLISR